MSPPRCVLAPVSRQMPPDPAGLVTCTLTGFSWPEVPGPYFLWLVCETVMKGTEIFSGRFILFQENDDHPLQF